MGMLNESILHWGREQSRALERQGEALDRNVWISGASKFTRLVAQIIILGAVPILRSMAASPAA